MKAPRQIEQIERLRILRTGAHRGTWMPYLGELVEGEQRESEEDSRVQRCRNGGYGGVVPV